MADQNHPYYQLRRKIIEILPLNGGTLVRKFEMLSGSKAVFEDHGAVQLLIHEFLTEAGGAAASRLIDWGFSNEHREEQPDFHADFAVTCTADQLVEMGYTLSDFDPEVIERVFGLQHFEWRESIVNQRREALRVKIDDTYTVDTVQSSDRLIVDGTPLVREISATYVETLERALLAAARELKKVRR